MFASGLPSATARARRLPESGRPPVDRARSGRLPWIGLGIAFGLVALAMLVPALTGWNVHVFTFPPLHADWVPRLGPGTLPALVIAALATRWSIEVADRASWRRLLLWSFVAALAWLLALALVDGLDGIGKILDTQYEYLHTARRLDDFGAALPEWVSRITYARVPNNWPVHVAGHPPGATLFFWVLAQFNLGSRYHRSSVSRIETDAHESRIESYKWFQLAAAQGYREADAACEPVTLAMTRDDVNEGNRRAAAFQGRAPKTAQAVSE